MVGKHLITGYSHIGIRVRDLGRARAFYELLGFRFIAGPLGQEPVALMDHESGVSLNLILNATMSGNPNILLDVTEKYPGYTHVSFYVDDLRATEKLLEKNAVVITEGPLTMPDGTQALFVRDPDGNVLEFNQRALPS